MMRKFSYDYDYENDSLFLFNPNSKSKASIELDNMIIDYDSSKNISGIELFNASKFFKSLKMGNLVVSKSILKEITACKVDIITRNNFFMIKFIILFGLNQRLEAPIYIPTVNEPSPALAY